MTATQRARLLALADSFDERAKDREPSVAQILRDCARQIRAEVAQERKGARREQRVGVRK